MNIPVKLIGGPSCNVGDRRSISTDGRSLHRNIKFGHTVVNRGLNVLLSKEDARTLVA